MAAGDVALSDGRGGDADVVEVERGDDFDEERQELLLVGPAGEAVLGGELRAAERRVGREAGDEVGVAASGERAVTPDGGDEVDVVEAAEVGLDRAEVLDELGGEA